MKRMQSMLQVATEKNDLVSAVSELQAELNMNQEQTQALRQALSVKDAKIKSLTMRNLQQNPTPQPPKSLHRKNTSGPTSPDGSKGSFALNPSKRAPREGKVASSNESEDVAELNDELERTKR